MKNSTPISHALFSLLLLTISTYCFCCQLLPNQSDGPSSFHFDVISCRLREDLITSKPTATTDETTQLMPINSAIKSAYAHRSSLQAQQQLIKQREHFALAELMGYLPQLSVRTSFFASGNPYSTHKRFILDATQLIFSFSGPLQQYRVEKETTHVAQWTEMLQRDQIRFDTEKNYLQLWLAQQKKDAIQATEQAAHYAITKARAQDCVGDLSEPDFVALQAAYTTTWATIFNYDQELKKSLLTLQDTLEVPIEFNLDNNSVVQQIQATFTKAPTYSLENLLEQAALNRKELPILEAQIKREQYLQSFFKGSYLPSASFFVALLKDDIGDITVFDTSLFWNVGIRFDWVFDGLSNFHRAQAAGTGELIQKLERQNSMLVIREEVQTAFHELHALLNDVNTAQAQLEQTQRLFQAQQKQYEVGLLATPDFVAAQQALQQAEFNLKQAQINATIKHQELLFKTGYPDHEPSMTPEQSLQGTTNEA